MEEVRVSDNINGFVCGPKDAAQGVVVIQEWWGITPIIKGHAESLAARGGFRCLIPDIYHGKTTVEKEEATHLMNNLDWQRAVSEICECVEYLRANGCSKIGVVGFCMGGALSGACAQHCNVDCAVSFYGTPPEALAQPESITVPMELHTGVLDDHKGFSDVNTVEAWGSKAKNATVFTYEHCGHGFLNTVRVRHHPLFHRSTQAWWSLVALTHSLTSLVHS